MTVLLFVRPRFHANAQAETRVCACAQVSGLSVWIGRQLEPMSGLPPWAVTLLACLLVSAVTEFASNPATLTVFLPILSALVWHCTRTDVIGRNTPSMRVNQGEMRVSEARDPSGGSHCYSSVRQDGFHVVILEQELMTGDWCRLNPDLHPPTSGIRSTTSET